MALNAQAQSSEEARENVDHIPDDKGEMTTAKVQHGDGSKTENFHGVEDETTPNVEYLRQKDYLMMYPRYEREYMEGITPKHQQPRQVPRVASCTFKSASNRLLEIHNTPLPSWMFRSLQFDCMRPVHLPNNRPGRPMHLRET